MPTILRKLPFSDRPTLLHLPGGPAVPIKHDQIVVWVSVTKARTLELPAQAPRFPAVLDTGFNDNFLISEQHLTDWAGVLPQQLPAVGFLRAEGGQIPLREASVWIHPNRPGFRDEFSAAPPFCLELDTGIAVWPARLAGSQRLPLLGLRGLKQEKLHLVINCQTGHVYLRTPRRFWFFG